VTSDRHPVSSNRPVRPLVSALTWGLTEMQVVQREGPGVATFGVPGGRGAS
jgi:hypothetical protein